VTQLTWPQAYRLTISNYTDQHISWSSLIETTSFNLEKLYHFSKNLAHRNRVSRQVGNFFKLSTPANLSWLAHSRKLIHRRVPELLSKSSDLLIWLLAYLLTISIYTDQHTSWSTQLKLFTPISKKIMDGMEIGLITGLVLIIIQEICRCIVTYYQNWKDFGLWKSFLVFIGLAYLGRKESDKYFKNICLLGGIEMAWYSRSNHSRNSDSYIFENILYWIMSLEDFTLCHIKN